MSDVFSLDVRVLDCLQGKDWCLLKSPFVVSVSEDMNPDETEDRESLKGHGVGISGTSVIQAEESVSNFLLPHKEQDSDAKASSFSELDKPKKSHVGLAENTTEEQKNQRESMHQYMGETEKLDPESSHEEAGHSTYNVTVLQCNQIPNSTDAANTLSQYEEECNTEKGEPMVEQLPRTSVLDSQSIADNKQRSSGLDSQINNLNTCGTMLPKSIATDDNLKANLNAGTLKEGKYFYYDTPLYEETGFWIPVSVPPMTENEHEEWTRGFCSNGGYIPEEDMGWNQFIGEDKELTMWDVVVEMLLAARGKVTALASGDIDQISWISTHLIEQAWEEMSQTLTEANFSKTQEILDTEPPKWLPDSAASSCMLCGVRFHPIMCTRHHCRFCGGIFCSECTKGRSLLPEKFRTGDPQRVCDVCCVRLESVQPYLMDQVSHAAQFPTHDLTDLSTLRSWVNFPWGQSMEYEIYKAVNTIRGYAKV